MQTTLATTVIPILDTMGIIVCSISGALMASRKRMDWFGAVVLATVTGLGGGTTRDLLLGQRPAWIDQPGNLVACAVVALTVVALGKRLRLQGKLFLYADALGLAAFMVLGTQKADALHVPFIPATVMGVMTGSAGGVIRDILCREIPFVLCRDIYATAALAGSVVFLFTKHQFGNGELATALGLLTTLGLRAAAIHWSLSLPVAESDVSP